MNIPTEIRMTLADAQDAPRECGDDCPVARAIKRVVPLVDHDLLDVAPDLCRIPIRHGPTRHYVPDAQTAAMIAAWDSGIIDPADWAGHNIHLTPERKAQ